MASAMLLAGLSECLAFARALAELQRRSVKKHLSLHTTRLLITNLRNDEITGCHDGVRVPRQLSENRRS
jgi:hypothetical protein